MQTELDNAIDICYEFQFSDSKKDSLGDSHILRVLENLNSDKGAYEHKYPHSLILQLTSNCNLRCTHCFLGGCDDSYSSANDLSEDELLKHLKYFVEEINIVYCSITGGEIFTSPSFLKILKYLKSKNVIIELLTNATMINEKMADKLSKTLNKRTDCIQVSLEAPSEEINDSIRGKNVFRKVIQNVKHLTSRGIKVVLAITVNSINTNQLEEMYDLCKSIGVSKLNVGRFQLSNSSQEYLVPETDKIFINVAKLIQKYQKDKMVNLDLRCIKPFDFLNFSRGAILLDKKLALDNPVTPQNLYCRPRHDVFTLFADGNITLCYSSKAQELCIGNIKENSFDEIWENRYSNPIFQERKIEDLVCKDCKYVSLCRGGCPINAYVKFKTVNAPGYNCKYAKNLL